jgi:Rap1a immunity proteins
MTKLRSFPAALIALLLSPVPVWPQAVARSYTAEFYVEGCKDFLAGHSNFFTGRCVGALEVLDALNDDTKVFCPPEGATNLQRVQAVVNYLETRPDRKNADFRLVTNQAMAKAWPCKYSPRVGRTLPWIPLNQSPRSFSERPDASLADYTGRGTHDRTPASMLGRIARALSSS